MSTRETVNRGFDAVATTHMRYRCSAGLRSSCFPCGFPVGTKTTSSRSNRFATSLAATRWPWWMGSNVPPITPTRLVRASLTGSSLKNQCCRLLVTCSNALECHGNEQTENCNSQRDEAEDDRRY